MSTKMRFWRWALASAALVATAGMVSALDDLPRAGVTTNDPAAIVIYPKIRVEADLCPLGGGNCKLSGTSCTTTDDCTGHSDTDTVVQLTNTSEFLTRVHCLYVNTNSHCSNDPETICTAENFRDVCPLGGLCLDGWQETNFRLTLTKRQPISWSVNDGLPALPLNDKPGQGTPPQFNDGNIPPVPENPFIGELRCIQVDVTTENPTDRNDLKGEASIITTDGSLIDDRKYNAIGILALEGRQDGDPNTLNIGGPQAEYGIDRRGVVGGCPNILTLNHFFDGANVVTHDESVEGEVNSRLTIVPCGADFLNQDRNPSSATVQFLIFNEFEQRFSTSTRVTCYKDVQLSDIDTRPGPDGNGYSIFSVGTQGTLTGYSRVRSVIGQDIDGYQANGILAILEEEWASGTCEESAPPPGAGNGTWGATTSLCASDADCAIGQGCTDAHVSTTAANIQFQGTREQGDRILIPIP